MPSPSSHNKSSLVELASIAAELHSVMEVAWGVSLAAKNAKVVSVQAGDQGRGFQPITQFIDEISQQAMKGVKEINLAALQLCKIAVDEQRSINAYQRFESVRTKSADARYIDSMAPAMKGVEQTMLESTRAFKTSLRHLSLLLESMDQCMLSARSIASVSRIVTSNAEGYRDKLKVVSDELDRAAIFIKEKVSHSYKHLGNVTINNHRRV